MRKNDRKSNIEHFRAMGVKFFEEKNSWIREAKKTSYGREHPVEKWTAEK